MCQKLTSFKPLFLSEEETLALLDLCLMSSAELDDAKELAIRKLTDLARQHIRETAVGHSAEGQAARAEDNIQKEISALSVGEILRSGLDGRPGEQVTPSTMMARSMSRSHAPRLRMELAVSHSRRRYRRTV